MMESKEAYAILGLTENASRADLEKRYALLIKRNHLNGRDASCDVDTIETMESVNRAYQRIIANELEVLQGEEEGRRPQKPNLLFKKLGINEEKVKNFLYYYKIHMLVTLVILIGLAFFIQSFVNKVQPDLKVSFIGDIYYMDTEDLNQSIKGSISGLKEIEIDGATLSDKMDGQQKMAMQMKAVTLLAAGDTDIFILDRVNFEKYANQDAFMDLEEIISNLTIDKNKYQVVDFKAIGDEKVHMYGVDISKSDILKQSNIQGNEKIVVINKQTKHYNHAVALLKLLLK